RVPKRRVMLSIISTSLLFRVGTIEVPSTMVILPRKKTIRSASNTAKPICSTQSRTSFVTLFFTFLAHRLDMKLIQLLFLHRVRSARQKARSSVDLGEGYDVTDIVGACKQHGKSVQSKSHSAVGRRAVPECLKHEPETVPGLLVGKPDNPEHPGLEF